MTAITNDDFSPQGLWRALRHYFEWLLNVIGDGAAVAHMHTLTRKQRDDVLTWLRPVEALLRRLIFLDAMALPHEAPRAPSVRVKRARIRRVVENKPDAPEDWHVRFRLVDPPARASLQQRRGAGAPHAHFSAWPLAERIEAALRAFNDPAPLARRLARLLRRKPALAQDFAAPPKISGWPRYGEEALKHAAAHAREALKNDSS
jgi:hypothetical protein